MSWMRILPACLLACLFLRSADAQETLDRVLVVVDEAVILESEVSQELQRYLMENKLDPAQLGEKLEQVKFDLVQAMIDNKVLYAVARKDTNIVVTDKDVERRVQDRLDEILRQVGGERRLEEMMGQPLKAIRHTLASGMRERVYVEEAQRRKLGKVEVTRQEVEGFFQAWQDSLPQVGESVHLSHIFLTWKPSPASETRARALCDSLYALLKVDPSRLGELATAFSQDPGSAAAGGSIGRTKRGNLVRAYEEAAYRLNPGELAAPVRSDYGWHLIRLDQREGEYIETSHILIKLEPTALDRQLIYDRADSLYNALQGGADFAPLATRFTDHAISRQNGGDLGWLELEQLQPLLRSRVRDLKEQELSRPLRGEVEGKEGMQIVKLLERRPARQPSLDADWSQLETMALNYKKQQLLKAWATELRDKVFIRVAD
jgi:peptidyl-prolyl cis-trans isomerase SurA